MNDYSKQVRDILVAEFPQFSQYERVEEPEQNGGYLVIEVQPPEPSNSGEALIISTENDEVTVSLDASHTHFNAWSHKDVWALEDDPTGALSAIVLIKEVLAEHTASASWWKGAEWIGSQWLDPKRKLIGATQFPAGEREKPDRVRVRSWRGTRNEDHTL